MSFAALIDPRHGRRRVAAGCVVWALLCLGGWSLCRGQSTIPAALEQRGVLTPERSAELRAQLRKQAELFEAQSAVVKTVAKLVGPAVVRIIADAAPRGMQIGRGRHIEDSGSGVIIQWQQRFYVLTNRHVVHDSMTDSIKIEIYDGRVLTPDKVWDDDETDVAVLAVTAADLVPATIGDSDRMDIGDFVLAIGNPFGLKSSVTFGIISGKGRHDLKLEDATLHLQDFLQTDAAINPGNSGGPLINLRGEVIGINMAIASQSGFSEGVGFAIPVNMFMAVARQLIEHDGVVTRAFIGVNLQANFGPALAAEVGLPRPMGAMVTGSIPGSPAALAHLQANDVIIEFNSVPVENESHLMALVSMTDVGKAVPLLVYRDRTLLHVNVELADRAKFATPPAENYEPAR